jgi:heme/copper-type cytochrome/quinol oxidase subunit 2
LIKLFLLAIHLFFFIFFFFQDETLADYHHHVVVVIVIIFIIIVVVIIIIVIIYGMDLFNLTSLSDTFIHSLLCCCSNTSENLQEWLTTGPSKNQVTFESLELNRFSSNWKWAESIQLKWKWAESIQLMGLKIQLKFFELNRWLIDSAHFILGEMSRLKMNLARAGGCEFLLIFDFFQIQVVPE